jgi:hypothetical protein
MRPCPCTELTGECCHDCPDCGGEGILLKRRERESKITPQEVDELLERSARGVEDLRKTLSSVFRLPSNSPRLR